MSLFIFLSSASWLIPNHYLPWTAAWNEALAISGLLALIFSKLLKKTDFGKVSLELLIVAILSCATVLFQFLAGKLFFFGDAAVTLFYLCLWILAVMAGRAITFSAELENGTRAIVYSFFFAALLSVGLALVQKTGALNLGVYVADLPPGGQPYANLAQPNNFCTLCFFGLCGLLYLQQVKKIGCPTFWLGAVFFCLGMISSQSRTGWLQMMLLVTWGMFVKRKANLVASRQQTVLVALVFLAGTLLWPTICDLLLLPVGRTVDELRRSGSRLQFWWQMVDAIGREPLWGYGWGQVAAAQQKVALDHPAIGEYFTHSHNLILDLLLWNGIPVGALLIGALAWWFITRVRACTDARVAWLLLAVGGVFLHAMLEYPLDYAYFLVPTGLMMGAIEGSSPSITSTIRVPRLVPQILSILLLVVFFAMSLEYFQAEENFRDFRMESAYVNQKRPVSRPPTLKILTQLGAFLAFARTEATPGMSEDQVDRMQKVSERFGSPPIMLRYALAAGLNGQPEVARSVLARLCKIHSQDRCREAVASWSILQARYPELATIQLQ